MWSCMACGWVLGEVLGPLMPTEVKYEPNLSFSGSTRHVGFSTESMPHGRLTKVDSDTARGAAPPA